jgi:hypothetical protein
MVDHSLVVRGQRIDGNECDPVHSNPHEHIHVLIFLQLPERIDDSPRHQRDRSRSQWRKMLRGKCDGKQ